MKRKKKTKKEDVTTHLFNIAKSLVAIAFMFLIVAFIFLLIQPMPLCSYIKEENATPIEHHNATYTGSDLEETRQEIIGVGYLVFRSRGYSMLPFIKDNSNCLCIEKEIYEVGDIVVFFGKSNEVWEAIGHEIISIEGDNITTQGTNNRISDPPIKEENILCHIPKIPRYKLFLQDIKARICEDYL